MFTWSASLLAAIFLITIGVANAESQVEYYKNLINGEVESALEYELPSDARMYEPEEKRPRDFGNYDFVIIGAGATGSVVANRLSEINGWKILLLEAGKYPNNFTMIPGYFAVNSFTEFNWGFKSIPQKTACLGAEDDRCPVPRGKGMGGTSLLHEMIYSRGNAKDYDEWSKLLNDSSWSYEHVLPYFKKSEDFHKTNPEAPVDWNYHAQGGHLRVNYHLPPSDLTKTFLKANKQLGYNVTDYNGKDQIGATILQINTKLGRRVDVAGAFVAPVMNRTNLVVSEESFVIKIEFSELTKQTTGVIFTRYNKTYRVKVDKEVILSAGAISSPQLLMLSGVGPKKHLEQLGISVVADLPVGNNLRDHVFCGVQFSSNASTPTQTTTQQIRDYLKGYGDLTAANPKDGAGWYKTSVEVIPDYPDVEMVVSSSRPSQLGKKFLSWDNETWDALFNVNLTNPFTLTPVLLHSHSAGTLRLKSSSPFDYPSIDYNLLSDPGNKDIDALYEGIQIALELCNTEAFRKIGARLEVRPLPACSVYETLSPDYWYCYIRQTAMAAFHPIGTCATGTDVRRGAVVDWNLNVFGVRGLRVADASVIPFTLSGHPIAPCVMIGEKVSDILKFEYGAAVHV